MKKTSNKLSKTKYFVTICISCILFYQVCYAQNINNFSTQKARNDSKYSIQNIDYFTNQLHGFEQESKYAICFTPNNNCTAMIVSAINQAKHNILVQAYVLTSYPIIKALIYAHKHDVDVKVIVDKNQYTQYKQPLNYLLNHGIDLRIDGNLIGLAHNKVIIIDDKIVITGSFNFTKSAQTKNAENVIFIQDKNIAKQYKNNWNNRQQLTNAKYTSP